MQSGRTNCLKKLLLGLDYDLDAELENDIG